MELPTTDVRLSTAEALSRDLLAIRSA